MSVEKKKIKTFHRKVKKNTSKPWRSISKQSIKQATFIHIKNATLFISALSNPFTFTSYFRNCLTAPEHRLSTLYSVGNHSQRERKKDSFLFVSFFISLLAFSGFSFSVSPYFCFLFRASFFSSSPSSLRASKNYLQHNGGRKEIFGISKRREKERYSLKWENATGCKKGASCHLLIRFLDKEHGFRIN